MKSNDPKKTKLIEIAYDRQQLEEIIDLFLKDQKYDSEKKKVSIYINTLEEEIKKIRRYQAISKPENVYSSMNTSLLEIRKIADDICKLTKHCDPNLPTQLKMLILKWIQPLEDALKEPLFSDEIVLKTKRLYAEQSFVCRQPNLQEELMIHLNNIKKLLSIQGKPAPRCYFSYAWPSEKRKEEEYWIQPFLCILRHHLKAAGIQVIMDIHDNKPGNSIVDFAQHYSDGDYIILIGTQSLREKHLAVGVHVIQTELNIIAKCFKQNQEQYGQSRIYPLLISGTLETAYPDWYQGYSTVRDAREDGYLRTLKKLTDWIYDFWLESSIKKDYAALWQEYFGSVPNFPIQAIEQEIAMNYHRRDIKELKQNIKIQGDSKKCESAESSSLAMEMENSDLSAGIYDRRKSMLKDKSSEIIVNKGYQYEDSDMINILKIRMRELKVSFTYSPDYPVGTTAISLKQYLKDERAEHKGARTLLIPYNIGGSHWVGMLLGINAHEKVTEIISLDSMGNGDEIQEIVNAAVLEASAVYPELKDRKVEFRVGWLQKDFTSCGPLAIENMLLIACASELPGKEINSAEVTGIRKTHIELYSKEDPEFYERQKNNVNRVASFQQQQQWLTTAGTQFTRFELKSITEIIELLQKLGDQTFRKEILEVFSSKFDSHREYLDNIRKSLIEIRKQLDLNSNEENIFYELVKILFGLERSEAEGSNFEGNYRLPYHAFKEIVDNIHASKDAVSKTHADIEMQIKEDEKLARTLQSRLWEVSLNTGEPDNSLSKKTNGTVVPYSLDDDVNSMLKEFVFPGNITAFQSLTQVETLRGILAKPHDYGLDKEGLSFAIIEAKCKNIGEDDLIKRIKKTNQLVLDVEEKDSQHQNTALHWCAILNYFKLANYLLVEEGFIDQRTAVNSIGLTPTQTAVLFGNNEFILSEFNKKPEFTYVSLCYKNLKEETVTLSLNELHLAILSKNISLISSIFKTFQDKCVNIEFEMQGIGNVLHLLVYFVNNKTRAKKEENPSVEAINDAIEMFQLLMKQPSQRKIIDLLTQQKANWEGCTPLMLAAKYDQTGLLSQFITYLKLDVEKAAGVREIEKAFYVAVEYGRTNVVKMFLYFYGFKPDLSHPGYLAIQSKLMSDKTLKKMKGILETYASRDYYAIYNRPIAGEQMYENLVLQGGGGKGVAYPYALRALKEQCDARSHNEANDFTSQALSFNHIVRIAGTSVGSIFAMGLAIGCSLEKMEKTLDYDFKDFLENDNVDKMAREFNSRGLSLERVLDGILKEFEIGLDGIRNAYSEVSTSRHPRLTALWQAAAHGRAIYSQCERAFNKLKDLNGKFNGFSSGTKLYQFLEGLIKEEGLSSDLTFGELAEKVKKEQEKGYKHLHVVVTNLTRGVFEVLSSENPIYSNYIILDAVRASAAYPIAFKPHQLRIKEGGVIKTLSDEYIDGGALRNYAIDEFDFKRYTNNDGIGDPKFPELNKATIGIRFKVEESGEREELINPPSFLSRIGTFISFYMEAEQLISKYMDREYYRSIVLNTGSINTFTFKKLEEEEKQFLKRGSQLAVENYFAGKTDSDEENFDSIFSTFPKMISMFDKKKMRQRETEETEVSKKTKKSPFR